jgi:hypothetical protein
VGVRKFSGEDDEFREWMAKRPRGYVLNTHRDYSDPENTRLHRGTYFTLEPGFGGGADQTGEQIKVCSPDPKELDQWAVANLGHGLWTLRCQHCDPTSLGLTD